MEPALKQRLLGAAVLLSLLIIFVPMFFPGADQAPSTASVNMDVPPAPADDLSTQVFDLDLPPEPSAAAATSAPVPAVAASAPAPAPSGTPSRADDGASPDTAASTRFAVSLGAYTNARDAEARLAHAKLLGYAAQVQAVTRDGQQRQAVRVGPFSSRAAAEAARLRLAEAMPEASPGVMALDGKATEAAPAAEPVSDAVTGWAVQVAAFRDRAAAEALRDTLRAAGFEGFVDQSRDSGGIWWRVRVGPRARRAAADQLQLAIKQKLGRDGLVVSHP